jgi:hypothetical protein
MVVMIFAELSFHLLSSLFYRLVVYSITIVSLFTETNRLDDFLYQHYPLTAFGTERILHTWLFVLLDWII